MKTILILFVLSIKVITASFAAADPVDRFDLEKTGVLTPVKLNCPYHRKRAGDVFSEITEGCLRVYPTAENPNRVLLFGPLNPCLGILVFDGTKALGAHKGVLNSSVSLCDFIQKNFDLSRPEAIYAKIFSTHNPIVAIERAVKERVPGQESEFGLVQSSLESIGIMRDHISSDFFPINPLRAKSLGRYSHIDTYFAVRLNDLMTADRHFKIFSIDPIVEDTLSLADTVFSVKDILGPETCQTLLFLCMMLGDNYEENVQKKFAYKDIGSSEFLALVTKYFGPQKGYVFQTDVFADTLNARHNTFFKKYYSSVCVKVKKLNSLPFLDASGEMTF
jgi:hypothetical protein